MNKTGLHRRIESVPQTARRYGITGAGYRNWMRKGVVPAPFKLGSNRSGIFVDETDKSLAAIAAGMSEPERRALVAAIHAERQEVGDVLRSACASYPSSQIDGDD